MESTTPKPKARNPVRIVDAQQLDDLYSLSHPFLTDPSTIHHLRQTKVMFLMRGLPGSGKSTIVNLLKQLYAKSVVVCSADHYFIDDQGVYNFNPTKIGQAHRVCQEKADEACTNNVLAVIIDNTNIRMDECRPYFQKASNHGYLVIIVEPRTSWKRDVDILTERNTHRVPREVIEARLKQYVPLIPFYFALFLNEEESNMILNQAYEFYQQALDKLPQLRSDLEQKSREKNVPVNKLLNRLNMSSQSKLLHCTMKFLGRVTDQSRKEFLEYAANRPVAHTLGKLCNANVVGFTITPRTLAARLHLTDRHASAIWAQDDNEPFQELSKSTTTASTSGGRSSHRQKRAAPVTTTDETDASGGDVYDTSMAQSLADDDLLLVNKIEALSIESERPSFLHPTSGFLSRAHLTCGVAPGVSAAQTGLDVLHLIRQEGETLEKNQSFTESEDERTVMRFFNQGQCIVYLKDPIPIHTIFSGFFH